MYVCIYRTENYGDSVSTWNWSTCQLGWQPLLVRTTPSTPASVEELLREKISLQDTEVFVTLGECDHSDVKCVGFASQL